MRYHQNISIDGIPQPAEFDNRRESAFFNEGKWRNFIAPLLPPDPQERTFMEIGCNVGLFLRLAAEYGFGRVVGVEADPGNVEMAGRYRDACGLDYTVLNRTVGVDFDWDELPAADVVLMANVHYYISMASFLPFVDRMRYKAVECLVVSRRVRNNRHGYPLADIASVRRIFADWELERVIDTTPEMKAGDPHPRHVHSLLFRGGLRREPIDRYLRRGPCCEQQELVDIVRSGAGVDLGDTINYRFWQNRKGEAWTDAQIRVQVQYRLDFTRDLMANGQKEPVLAWAGGEFIDGGNRLEVLKLLGQTTALTRVI